MEVLETLGTDGDIPKGRTDFQAITYGDVSSVTYVTRCDVSKVVQNEVT